MVGRLDTRLVSWEAPSVLQATNIWSTHEPSRQRRPIQRCLRQLESLGSPCGFSMEKKSLEDWIAATAAHKLFPLLLSFVAHI